MPIVMSDRQGRALGRRSKYHATPVFWCGACARLALTPCPVPDHAGWRFASKAEAWYWWDVLRPAAAAGTISLFQRQVRFPLWLEDPHGAVVHFGTYTADFAFVEARQRRVIDVKGTLTRDGKLRLKLMRVCHGITVELVRSTPPRRWLEDAT